MMVKEIIEGHTAPADDLDSLLSKAKWRNIAFDKLGKSHRGHYLYASKDAAAARVAEVEAKMKAGILDGISTSEGEIDKENYHYSMQMPELGK